MARRRNAKSSALRGIELGKLGVAVISGFALGFAVVEIFNIDLIRRQWIYGIGDDFGGAYYVFVQPAQMRASESSVELGPFPSPEAARAEALAHIARNGGQAIEIRS